MSTPRLTRVRYDSKTKNYVCRDCGRKTPFKAGILLGNADFLHDEGCPSVSITEDAGVFHTVIPGLFANLLAIDLAQAVQDKEAENWRRFREMLTVRELP